MRNRNFLPIFLLALALTAPVAMADPSPGTVAFAKMADDGKGKSDKDKSKDQKWKDDDRDRDWEDDRGRRGSEGVPHGHLPPPGECRVWRDGVPPGHQPPPTDCATARREAARNGGRVIYGNDRRDDRWNDDHRDDDRWDDHRRDDDRWDGATWIRRFDGLDRNDDGYLSRSEWTAEDRIFNFIDVNRDGRLSRNEVRDARDRSRDQRGQRDRNLENRFRDSDDNRDGRLSLNEWWGRDETFDRLDRNNDGYLSRAEIVGRDRRSSR